MPAKPKGLCSTRGCRNPAHVRGLCKPCYAKDQRKRRKERKALIAAGRLPPQGVAAQRMRAEREVVEYDPHRHPGVFKRALLVGNTARQCADIIGVSEETLLEWVATKEGMKEAARAEKEVNGHIGQALVNAALGKYNPETGEYRGGNAMLLKHLSETRLGMVAPKHGKGAGDAPPGTPLEVLTSEEGQTQAKALLGRMLSIAAIVGVNVPEPAQTIEATATPVPPEEAEDLPPPPGHTPPPQREAPAEEPSPPSARTAAATQEVVPPEPETPFDARGLEEARGEGLGALLDEAKQAAAEEDEDTDYVFVPAKRRSVIPTG